MSLIAGYVSRHCKHETSQIREIVRSYSPSLYGYAAHCENKIIDMEYGHIIQKYKKDYPIYHSACEDLDNNVLVTLGFFYPSDRTSNPEKLLEACRESSAQALEECEGEFVSIFAEQIKGKIHIVNDRFGSRPFYTFHATNATYFSSDLAFLLHLSGVRHKVDVLGWLQIFAFGHTIEKRINFKHIKRLRPATHLIISPEDMHEKQYWQLEFKPEKNLDPELHSEQVFEAFLAGVSMRAGLAGKGLLALSGGLDSRLIAGSLPEKGGFEALTFVNSTSTSNTTEVRTAAQVSDILRLEHHIVQLPKDQNFWALDDLIMLTGGLRPLHHMSAIMTYIDHLRQRKFNFLLGGGPGDNLCGSFIPSEDYLRAGNLEKFALDYFSKKSLGGRSLARTLGLLIREDIINQYLPLIERSFLNSFKTMRGPTPAHSVSAWEMVVAFPGFTAISPIHSHPDVMEAFCHLDYTYCDLMLRLPADWLYSRNFYCFMINKKLPTLKHTVNSNYGKTLLPRMRNPYLYDSISCRAKSLMRNYGKKVFRRFRLKDQLHPFHYCLFNSDDYILEKNIEFIHSFPLLTSILDKRKCLQFISNFKKERLQTESYRKDSELFSALSTLCFTIKNFISYM